MDNKMILNDMLEIIANDEDLFAQFAEKLGLELAQFEIFMNEVNLEAV